MVKIIVWIFFIHFLLKRIGVRVWKNWPLRNSTSAVAFIDVLLPEFRLGLLLPVLFVHLGPGKGLRATLINRLLLDSACHESCRVLLKVWLMGRLLIMLILQGVVAFRLTTTKTPLRVVLHFEGH